MDPALEVLRGGRFPITAVRTGLGSPRPRLDTVVNAATNGRLCFCESVEELGVAKVAELPVATEGTDDEVAIGVVVTTTAKITCELSYIHVAVNIVLLVSIAQWIAMRDYYYLTP